ncbi:tRNA (guanine-N(7)-)-methyltransferase-like [Schistocerca gregaria]|uniref:tRNA (guanine-N(7)-)-methyltransferase-like n=1 Tax=Schistocerca gregaria TaxID=7010 RepID=UPI00211DC032|nr:tRNA (guanine-N(7)-)-methyltransferase-like [Schistocerca gregaria]
MKHFLRTYDSFSMQAESDPSIKSSSDGSDSHESALSCQKDTSDDTFEHSDTHSIKPKKRIRLYHRTHAHRNPLSDSLSMQYPINPDMMDWPKYYPFVWSQYQKQTDNQLLPPRVEMADIGCGYGGLLIALSRLFPNRLTLGLDIRTRVLKYVDQRLEELRSTTYNSLDEVPLTGNLHPLCTITEPIYGPSNAPDSHTYFQAPAFPPYHNVAAIETNAMKHLPNLFHKRQLDKIFFLFPDPHFKKAKYRLRIINSMLLDQYAYVLREGGYAYIATDVKDLYDWMERHFLEHPLFEKVTEQELCDDPVINLIPNSTEESRKAKKQNRSIFYTAFKRIPYDGKNHAVYKFFEVD